MQLHSNKFRNYFYAKAFKIPLTILFNKFWLCLLKLLVKVTAMYIKHILRLLPYSLIISFFLNMPVLCFVSASCLISLCLFCKYLCQYSNWNTRLSNLFYTNSFIFIFVDINIEFKYAIHSDLVICNNFINYKVLPASDFHFIGLESS